MAKLIIEITGDERDVNEIAGHFSDGGGEQSIEPVAFEDDGRHIAFDYSRCFEGHGYVPSKHGVDRVIVGTVEK